MDTQTDKGKTIAAEVEYVGLDGLRIGSNSTIRVMICRRWDVTNTYGRYRSTEYIVSDIQGNAIQVSARSNISHCFVSKLEEGKVVSIANFSVVVNKEKYRIRNGDAYVIELEGYTIVKKLDCSVEGFARFPFQLIQLEEIHANDSTYLIDVMGCAIDVGTVRTTKSGSELLECRLINERGTRIRITMWGSLCANFVKRAGHGNATDIIILPSMNIKEYLGEIYLSNTSATTLFDAIDIPQIAELHSIFRKNNTPVVHCLPSPPTTQSVKLSQLICMGKQQKETRRQTLAVHCAVRIESVRAKDSWFYYSCGYNGCKKKLDRAGPKFFCKTCKKDCDFPRTSYRLHVNVADDTGSIVATLFDDVAKILLKRKAASFLAADEATSESEAIPQEIMRLANTCHIFEMKTHTYFAKDCYVSFTVNKLIESHVTKEAFPLGLKRCRDDSGSENQLPDSKMVCADQAPQFTDTSAVADEDIPGMNPLASEEAITGNCSPAMNPLASEEEPTTA